MQGTGLPGWHLQQPRFLRLPPEVHLEVGVVQGGFRTEALRGVAHQQVAQQRHACFMRTPASV